MAQQFTIEMHRSPEVTEEEVRRRLAACYRLLLDLAEKHKSEVAGDDNSKLQPDVPARQLEAERQKPGCTRNGSRAGAESSGDQR